MCLLLVEMQVTRAVVAVVAVPTILLLLAKLYLGRARGGGADEVVD